MLNSKEQILKPLIESHQGLHLTIYLEKHNDIDTTKNEIKFILSSIRQSLIKDMRANEVQEFLEPIEKILESNEILEQITGNIGIFRNKSFFRVINIPTPLDKFYQLANSFHVKPILSWLQSDKDFLILGFENDHVYIYSASKYSLKLIDKIVIEPIEEKNILFNYIGYRSRKDKKLNAKEVFSDLNSNLELINKNIKGNLFLAGSNHLIDLFLKSNNDKKIIKLPIANEFNKFRVTEIYLKAKLIQEQLVAKKINDEISEFLSLAKKNKIQKSIYHISKSVIQGKVKKLLVAENINIYGKLNRSSGDIDLHPFDLDNEDDCIMDDLAQIVLSQGGEVILVNTQKIDKNRPILAIAEN